MQLKILQMNYITILIIKIAKSALLKMMIKVITQCKCKARRKISIILEIVEHIMDTNTNNKIYLIITKATIRIKETQLTKHTRTISRHPIHSINYFNKTNH